MKPAALAGWLLLGAVTAFLLIRRENAPATPTSIPHPAVSAMGTPGATSTSGPAHDPRPAADPASKLARLMEAGDAVGLQRTAGAWFETNPAAVREWLDAQPDFARLQPVLIQISQDIAASGQPAEALKWAELLDEGPDRDHTLFAIYATGRRYGALSEAELRAAPFTPRQIEDLLSGAADD